MTDRWRMPRRVFTPPRKKARAQKTTTKKRTAKKEVASGTKRSERKAS